MWGIGNQGDDEWVEKFKYLRLGPELPTRIDHYEEIKDFTIRGGCNVTLENLAELWPGLKSPRIEGISDDTIHKFMEWYTTLGHEIPPLFVRMDLARQIFDVESDVESLSQIASQEDSSNLSRDRIWLYTRGDKWFWIRTLLHHRDSPLLRLMGNLTLAEATPFISNLILFYKHNGVKIRGITEIAPLYMKQWFEPDARLQMLISIRMHYELSADMVDDLSLDKKLIIFLELLTGNKHPREEGAKADYLKIALRKLEGRLVEEYSKHGALGESNLKLLAKIADELQADPMKRDQGHLLAKTALVLGHHTRGKYKSFFSK